MPRKSTKSNKSATTSAPVTEAVATENPPDESADGGETVAPVQAVVGDFKSAVKAKKVLQEINEALYGISTKYGYRIDIYGARFNTSALRFHARVDSTEKPKPKKVAADVAETVEADPVNAGKSTGAGVKASGRGKNVDARLGFMEKVESQFNHRPENINRAEIKEVLAANVDLKWPSWLTADKSLRAGRGVFRLPWEDMPAAITQTKDN